MIYTIFLLRLNVWAIEVVHIFDNSGMYELFSWLVGIITFKRAQFTAQ